MYKFFQKNIELVFFIGSLLWLYFLPLQAYTTTSFCVFKLVGFSSCWGCGIGHAIHHALHLQWQASFQEHAMGIPAVFIFLYRILYLLILQIKQPKNHEFLKRYSRHRFQ